MQVLSALFRRAELRREIDPLACGTITVSHIIFTDDLMVFLKVDKNNGQQLKLILDEFSAISGLNINMQKSSIYFGGHVKDRQWITSHLGLSTGELPVRYLGLPLLSKRLSVTDCGPLLQAVMACLQSWKAKLLSYVGRLELIRTMLSVMHLYWTAMFILPASVLQNIDRVMMHFLWYGHGQKRIIYVS